MPRKTSAFLWVFAAIGAIVLHAAAIGGIVMHLDFSDAEDQFGAESIEVGLEMLAPHEEETDLPPGQVSEASTASPAVTAQKATPDESDLPRAKPIETDDPDQLVSPDATKKTDDKNPVIKQVEAMPSAESVAAEETAPPASEAAQESTKSVAPVQGTGQSAQKIITAWQKELISYLHRHQRWPDGQTRRNLQVLLDFTIDRTGHVLSVNVVKSSGYPSYDEAALAMVKRSDPVPQPPAVIADMGLTFPLPVNFVDKK